MAVFVLIHGSMHGAWCWQLLVRELEARGHHAIAPELPCEDVTAGLVEYAAAVEEQIRLAGAGQTDRSGTPDQIVLVGHSLGSRTVPVVAAKHPGARMIFLCSAPTALGPVEPDAFSGMVTPEYTEAAFEERPDGARRIALANAPALFFHDCDEETAKRATEELRWQGSKPLSEPSPIEVWPAGPMHMIVAEDDRVARPDWLLSEAMRWLEEAPAIVLPGGHSPMLSRPSVLAECLIECTLGGLES